MWESGEITVAKAAKALKEAGLGGSPERAASVLFDLQSVAEAAEWFPFTLLYQAEVFSLTPKSTTISHTARSAHVARVHIDPIDDRTLEVLAAIVFSDGITATRLGEIMSRDVRDQIGELDRQGLVFGKRVGPGTYWYPHPRVLERYGLKSFAEIDGYAEYKSFLRGETGAKEALDSADRKRIKRKRQRQRSQVDQTRGQSI